ncbi:MAG: CDP-alcohol phosphatidyltransferase family protein [Terriglobales bacterium]|jgi:phosphatidylglycerophosphate synthase
MSTQTYTQIKPALPFSPANRLQQSFVAGAEKKTLIWLALRTPRWINSDHLTILGFASQCLAGVCYALARWNRYMLLLGIVFLALNWLGDSLDGTLARVRNCQRPRYGFYVDHIVDTFAALFLMGGLALSGCIHPAIALGMLIAFLMLSIEAYLATYTLGQFQLSYWKFGPTEIRLLLALGNLCLLRWPTANLMGMHLRLLDIGGVIGIVGMALMLIVSAIQHTRTLYREEKIS